MILDRSRWLPPGTAAAAAERRIVRTAGTCEDAAAPRDDRRGRLAVVPRTRSVRRQRQTEPARTRGIRRPAKTSCGARRSPDSRTRVRSCRATRSSSPARSAAAATPPSSPVSTATAMHPTIDRSIAGCSTRSTSAPGRSAGSGPPRRSEPRNKRHIKSTYASASPATDGRIVVAWFGSQGIYAYDVDGGLRWSVDLGRVDMGAYDIPAYRVGTGELADHLERPGDRAVRHAGRFVPARAQRRDRRDDLEDRSPGAAVVGHADDRHDAGRTGADHQRVELRARLRSEDRQGAVAAWRQLEDHGADADLRRTACTSSPAAARRSGRCLR